MTTFPAPFLGRAESTTNSLGTSLGRICSRANIHTRSLVLRHVRQQQAAAQPPRRTTNAFTASPRTSSGIPITAAFEQLLTLQQLLLDLTGADALTAAFQKIVRPIYDIYEAVLIHSGEISGIKFAIAEVIYDSSGARQ